MIVKWLAGAWNKNFFITKSRLRVSLSKALVSSGYKQLAQAWALDGSRVLKASVDRVLVDTLGRYVD